MSGIRKPRIGNGGFNRSPTRIIILALALAAATPLVAAGAQRSSDPMSPAQSLAAIHLKEGYEIELVASEPLIESPVALDWGPDGRLWVVEMRDYPYGIDGHGKPGGRVKVLEDTHHDGHFDKATTFLDGINMPNGLSVWRNGVIVTAAPDILYAQDSSGSGKADRKTTLYSGFRAGNPQLRVNALRWGLDGWLYCANGWSGGQPSSVKTGQKVKLDGHDIRLKPDEGLLDLQAGQSEFGRDCDDWANWFGCDNSHPLFYFPLDDNYTRRNANVPYPDPRAQVIVPPNPQVYPVSKPQKRYYNDQLGYVTSACSSTIYRDDVLFPGQANHHVFYCEPAYNLLGHEVLQESGVSFTAHRPPEEKDREFLACEDQWFRPVMVRTGPDGALWVVDMYRYMIEHPDWLPPQGKEELRPFYRDGEDRGRIYRIYPKGHRPGPLPRLDKLSISQLVGMLDCSNGTLRDMVQKQLVWKRDPQAIEPLQRLATTSARPATRLAAIYTLDDLGALPEQVIGAALRDPHPALRRAALRLAEPRAKDSPRLLSAALELSSDPDPKVRLQLACSLGQWEGPAVGQALGRIAASSGDDPYFAAAVMSSATKHFGAIVEAISHDCHPLAEPLYSDALSMALATKNRPAMASLLSSALRTRDGRYSAEQFLALDHFLTELPSHQTSVSNLGEEKDDLSAQLEKLPEVFAAARPAAADPHGPEELRAAAAALLGQDRQHLPEDLKLLGSLLAPQVPPRVQEAAVRSLGRINDPQVVDLLIGDWSSHSPQLRLAIIDRLAGRTPWALQLLEKMRSGTVSRNDLDAARRERLLENADGQVKTLAREVIGAAPDPSRQHVVDQYQDALSLKGDPQRGAKIFVQNCAVCHRKGNIGNDIGPNLGSVVGWRGDALLVAILDPSRQVAPGFFAYTATLNDGDAVYGIITSESGSSVTMKGLDAKPRTFLRSQIKSLVGTNRSLMPDGFEAALDKQALADIVSFLQSSGPDK